MLPSLEGNPGSLGFYEWDNFLQLSCCLYSLPEIQILLLEASYPIKEKSQRFISKFTYVNHMGLSLAENPSLGWLSRWKRNDRFGEKKKKESEKARSWFYVGVRRSAGMMEGLQLARAPAIWRS